MWNNYLDRAIRGDDGAGKGVVLMEPLRILVVDDEPSICLLLRDVLTPLGHHVETLQDGQAAIELAGRERFDVAFLDIRMPGMNGLDVLKAMRELCPDAKFVMITGFAQTDVVEECMKNGASACLGKPFSITQVMKLLQEMQPSLAAPRG